MADVFLVRHGATEWNESKRAQGQADIALNEEGRRQTLEVARRLAQHRVDAVYSSDLSRAVDTARAIADAHGLQVATDPAFREIDQGEWEGLFVDEIRLRWPNLWGEARHFSSRPGGESPSDVRSRALAALTRAVASDVHGTIVVVSHGGTIRWLSAEALGFDDRRAARIRGLGNAGVVSVRAEINDGRLELSDLKRLDGRTTDLDDPND